MEELKTSEMKSIGIAIKTPDSTACCGVGFSLLDVRRQGTVKKI